MVSRGVAWLVAEQFATAGEFVAALAIGQKSELAEALKAARQNVEQEATDELFSSESHRSLLIAAGVVFPGKSNAAIFKC